MEYKICSRCIMDTTSDPNIVLDDKGVCNYCNSYDKIWEKRKRKINSTKNGLEGLFDKIKQDGKSKEYDCIIGMSGGVDSAYLAYIAKQYGLRPLVVHVDAGWNSEIAVQNIEKMCKKLEFDLHTVVIDWPTMKELQRAYMFSGLANLDVPQDHCFFSAVWQFSRKYHIKYVLSGSNFATEGILSKAYQYTNGDWKNIKDVYSKNGRGIVSLKKYPHVGIIGFLKMKYGVSSLKQVMPLDYIEYSKEKAIEVLEREFGWKYYGGKHYESRFTKFFQETYLPQRYGWEKRRDHLSSLIVGGEMTRDDALREISVQPSTTAQMKEDLEYVLKKLDISNDEWESIILAPKKNGEDYKSYSNFIFHFDKAKSIVKQIASKMNIDV